MRGQLAFALAAFSAIVAVLAFGLRPDAFFVGDPGVKLASTRNALRFPTHPLQIPLPTVGTEATPHVESFFAVHGDHAHAVTSEFFPVLSAPMLAAFGLRGLYVLPALGFIATAAACAWLAVVLDPRRNAALVVRCGGPRHAVSLLWARVLGAHAGACLRRGRDGAPAGRGASQAGPSTPTPAPRLPPAS